MAGLTNATSATALDAVLAAGDYIGYSTNGSSEAAILTRTAVVAWAAATVADPSVKANANALTSATASGAGTVTHYAVYSAVTAGTQKTDWQAVASSKTLAIGDTVTWAIGALQVTLT
jgi:hypothetical protein